MTDTPRSDEELLVAIRQGDRSALEELLAAHEPQIYRFGLRMCGSEEDAREVLQETLLAAFRHLGGFRGDAQLSTWLYQIARSFCIKLRRPGRDVRPESSLDADDAREVQTEGPLPDDRAHAREIGEAISAALSTLSVHHREVLVLRDVEGLSAEEASEVLGIEVGAQKSRLHRARHELRQRLALLLDPADGDEHTPRAAPCPELAEELSAYAEAELEQATCVQIEAHLARCPRCAGACEALQRTVSLCRQLPEGEVPAPVRAAVRHALAGVLGRAPE
jgi:RNA polymerase sigma-70 factor (ECF subfamily)